MNAAAVSLAARIVLAGVLLFAAVTKFRARDATRTQTVAVVGARFGPAVALVLPYAECAIAVALVVWWSPVPGIVALLLLLGFSAFVVRAQLRRLPCPCFGGSSTRAAGPASIARNALLAAYAVLATASPSGASAGAALLLTVVFGAVAAAAVAVS